MRARVTARVVPLLAALACGPSTESDPQILAGLPAPASGDVVEAALSHFAEARARVTDVVAAGDEGKELGVAIGALGMLYLVHEYPEAALECFRRAQDQDPAEARWPYLAGYVRQLGGELPEAATAFERALELRPDYPALLYRLGEVELDRNRPAAAADHFRHAIEIDAQFAGAHFGLGRAALAQGNHRLAITHLEEALARQPEATRIHHPLGLAYRGIGDLDQAEYHLGRRGDSDILLVDPWIAAVEALALEEGGRVESAMQAGRSGDQERARREYAAAVEADPDDLIARHNLAVSLARQGDPRGAEHQYREILQREPANSHAAFNLGTLLAEQGRLQEAIDLYRAALAAAPDFKQARMNLGAALGRSGRWQEAVSEYDRLIEVDPDFASVRSVRALALVEAGRPDEGLAELRELLRSDPAAVDERIALASVLLRRGDRQAALAELDAGLAATASAAGKSKFQLRAGALLGMVGDLEGATLRLRSAGELDPQLAEASLILGRLLLRAGRPREAAVEFGRAVELRPNAVTLRLAEVHALWSAGDCAAAYRQLEAGREVMPRSGQLAHGMARLLATCPDDGLRDGENALSLARELVAAQPSGVHNETLAMALAETGRFAEAIEIQTRLLAEAEGRAAERVVQRLQSSLERYRRGEPVRLTGLEQ